MRPGLGGAGRREAVGHPRKVRSGSPAGRRRGGQLREARIPAAPGAGGGQGVAFLVATGPRRSSCGVCTNTFSESFPAV